MKKKFTFLIAAFALLTMMVLPEKAVGQTRATTIISEDFSDITAGSSTSSSGSNTPWDGNTNFPTKSNAYKAGGAVRIGASSNTGYITSKQFDAEEGTLTVALDIKGWGASGSVQITFNGSSQTVSCSTSSWSDGFESKSVNFTLTGDVTGKTIKIASTNSSKRMFVDNVVVTNTPPPSVATPTFELASGRTGTDIITEDIVMLDCETDGATIYYTIGANPADPTSSSTEYDPNEGIEVNANTTIKAIAIKGEESSVVASATYTVYTPLTSMQAIYENAEANIAEHTVAITFGNWVVTGVNGDSGTSNQNTAFLTDGTKGCIIYKNGGGLTFSKGDILSGSVICKLQRYSSSADYYAEITELMSNTEGLTVNTGGSVTPVETTIDALSTVNVGSVVTIRNLYYNDSYLSDGTNKIVSFNTLGYSTYTNGKTYDVTGVFTQAYNSNSTKRILPSTSSDVVLKATMTATDFSGLVPFTYLANQGGPSAVQSVTISGSDFGGDLTVAAPDNYQVSSDNSTWGTTATFTQSSGTVSGTLYIRLAAGLSADTYNGNLTCAATNLTTKEVALEGIVTENALYTVSIATGIENGTIESNKTIAEENTTVTITVTPADCYELATLTYNDGTTTTNIDKTTKQFTMPASNVTVNATFTQKTYTISYSVNGTVEGDLEDEVTCGNTVTLWNATKLETEGIDIPAGFVFYGWSATAVDLTQTAPTLVASSYVPTADMTLYAVFATAVANGYKYTLVGAGDMEEGTYLIGALKNTSATNNFYFATKSTSSGAINVNATATTIAEVYGERSITTLPASAVEFAFTGNNSDGFTISSGNDYLGSTDISQNNKLAFGDYSSFKWKAVAKDNPLITNGVYLQYQNNDSYYYISENTTNTNCIRGYYSSNNIYRAIYLFKKVVNYTYANYCSTVEMLSGNVSGTKAGACTVASAGATVKASTTLNVTGVLVNSYTADKLVVEDGGQLITSNAVAATVQKSISATTNWGTESNGWYFIASPVSDDVDPDEEVGMITDYDNSNPTYDLYYLDPSAVLGWKNYRNSTFDLTNGKGYLYASKDGITPLAIAGTVKASAASQGVTIYYGWNLIGNPFTYNTYLNKPYYKMNDERTGLDIVEDYTDDANFIAPFTGVVVNTTETSETVTFSKTPAEQSVNQGNIHIALAQTETTRGDNNTRTLDNAIVSFNEGSTLGKFYFGTQNANIYIPQDGEQYAIVSAEAQGETPVNFKAAKDGQYTITVNPEEVEMGYLHLIDNIAGTDIDLLATPSYTFNAKGDDYESRFRLVFSANIENEIGNGNDDFAFFSNGQLIVTGEGTLQVVDMMGRVISSEVVNGTSSKAINAKAGVYVLRLVNGENVKTQKIVVR